MELNVFSDFESEEFLIKRSKKIQSDGNSEAARALSKELGHLPLALEQAAAYIEHLEIELVDYLQLYKDNGLRVLRESEHLLGRDHEPVENTFNISIATIEKDSPSSIQLLNVLAFLGPDAIPDWLLLNIKYLEPWESTGSDCNQLGINAMLQPLITLYYSEDRPT